MVKGEEEEGREEGNDGEKRGEYQAYRKRKKPRRNFIRRHL